MNLRQVVPERPTARSCTMSVLTGMAIGTLLRLATGCAHDNSLVRMSYDVDLVEACTSAKEIPPCASPPEVRNTAIRQCERDQPEIAVRSCAAILFEETADTCAQAQARWHLAVAHDRLGERQQAFRLAAQIISRGPKTPSYRKAVALINRLEGKVSDAAVEACRKTIANDELESKNPSQK